MAAEEGTSHKPSGRLMAAGFKLEIEKYLLSQVQEIVEESKEDSKEDDSSRYIYLNEYRAGVCYTRNCKLGSAEDSYRTNADVETWYRKKRGKRYQCVLTKLHLSKKTIFGEFTVNTDRFIAPLTEFAGGTTIYKKNILNGSHSGTSIDVRIVFPVEAYIHYK